MSTYRYYFPLGVFFVAILLITNTISVKIVQLGSFSVAAGIIIFPISYIFGDILTEVYGYRGSRPIIWLGFAAQIFMSLCYWLAQQLPAAPFWPHQESYELILGAVPRIVLASMIAYLVGEFANSFVLSRLKVWMNGKHLWVRTISSTLVGEGIDSFLFGIIAFAGILPGSALWITILSGYGLKVAYEILATPFTYAIVGYLKRAENIDVFDERTSYNPFRLRE